MPTLSDLLRDMSLFGLVVFLASLCVFAVYYVIRSRAGSAMTVDVWFVFYFLLVQNFLFLPVSYSSLNAILLGDIYYDFIGRVDAVVWLSLIGAACAAMGARLGWRGRALPPGLGALHRAVDGFWMTGGGPVFGLAVLLALMALLLMQGIGFGQARTAVMEQPALQPINNLLNACAQLFVLISLFRIVKARTIGSVLLFLLILGASFFGGTRSASVWPLLLGGAVIMHLTRVRRILPMLAVVGALIFFSVAYGQFRNDKSIADDSVADFMQDLLFGGHLTEQRDFAWLLSVWDGTYLYGKSILAGLLGFIPSFISDFRQEWSWGKFTARAVGFDPTTFSGFRLPLIGELYFNFSWPGVCVVSFVFGYVVFRCSRLIEQTASMLAADPHRRRAAATLAASVAIYLNLFQLALVSVTIFVVYVHVGILVCGWLFSRLTVNPPRRNAALTRRPAASL